MAWLTTSAFITNSPNLTSSLAWYSVHGSENTRHLRDKVHAVPFSVLPQRVRVEVAFLVLGQGIRLRSCVLRVACWVSQSVLRCCVLRFGFAYSC